ncbi:hypothetical protein GCM10027447_21960 [Glycomyces halotolerans]
MDRIRRRYGTFAATLAGLAAAVTLGHLLGPHGHLPTGGHEHHHAAETTAADCPPEPDADGHPGHEERNCGALLLPATTEAALDDDRPSTSADELASLTVPTRADLGPNGRAPPDRTELQISRV